MAVLVTDPALSRDLLAERREAGVDRFDEVWDGLRVLTPVRDDEHQRIVSHLLTVFFLAVEEPGLGDLRFSINVSDRVEGWTRNYRCPDLAVRLKGGEARILKTHWHGGPDFVVEVVSPGDQSRKKLGFYAGVGTREVLLVDRKPWALALYGLEGGRLVRIGASRPGSSGGDRQHGPAALVPADEGRHAQDRGEPPGGRPALADLNRVGRAPPAASKSIWWAVPALQN